MIAAIEAGWSVRKGGTSSAGSRVGLATSVVTARGTVRLETAETTVPLDCMLGTRFVQDDPSVHDALLRFLDAYLERKSLISGTSLPQGARFLALSVATVRWYAVARATMAERPAVEDVDVRYAIRLVEQTLSRAPALKQPRFVALLNFLFQRVAPASALYPSPYPI
jgi:hypothetical protein